MSRRYSQWDWSAMRYNYFVGSEPSDPGGFAALRGIRFDAPPPKDGGVLGVDIDSVLRPLPAGVRFLGVGPRAIGEVVRSTRGIVSKSPRRSGLGSAGEAVIEPLLEEMVAASGGTKTHPGVTIEALDHPPFAVALTTGLALGFSLGRSFGSTGRVVAWTVAGIFGLMAAGARRKAFLQMQGIKGRDAA
jgi:hypothetical protein